MNDKPRAVPEAHDDHRDEEIHRGAHSPAAASAERDIEIIAHPARKGHVPGIPELLNIRPEIRRIKVLRNKNPKHHARRRARDQANLAGAEC